MSSSKIISLVNEKGMLPDTDDENKTTISKRRAGKPSIQQPPQEKQRPERAATTYQQEEKAGRWKWYSLEMEEQSSVSIPITHSNYVASKEEYAATHL